MVMVGIGLVGADDRIWIVLIVPLRRASAGSVQGSGVKISGLYLVLVALTITNFLSWSLCTVMECLRTDSFRAYVLWQFQH